MSYRLSALAVAILLVATPVTAQAQRVLGPDEVVVRGETVAVDATVPVDAVRAIALDYGIARIESMELDDGRWEVEGVDLYDRDIELEIDAYTGVVLYVDR